MILWMFMGLIVGVMVWALLPGRERGGAATTLAVAATGGAAGGYLGRGLGWYGQGEPTSLVMAVIGSVALLAFRELLRSRSS
jgi:uncharacterized membrane protein YeaQ/YmgE (transglycosylase-associated protein family)